jgi:hypothetical protein
MREAVVHLVQAVDDEVDRRMERLFYRVGTDQPLLRFRPIGGAVGQLLLTNDDEDVEVRFILVRRQRRIDPVVAR